MSTTDRNDRRDRDDQETHAGLYHAVDMSDAPPAMRLGPMGPNWSDAGRIEPLPEWPEIAWTDLDPLRLRWARVTQIMNRLWRALPGTWPTRWRSAAA